jgi:hypothetical protein
MTATTTNSSRTKLVNISPEYSQSDNEYDTPDKRIHRTLPNFHNCVAAFDLETALSQKTCDVPHV